MTTNYWQWLPITTNDYQWLMFKSDGTLILRWSCYSPSSTAQPVGSFLVSNDFGRCATSWIRIDCRKGFQTCNCIILILDTILEEKKVTFLQEPDLYEKKIKTLRQKFQFQILRWTFPKWITENISEFCLGIFFSVHWLCEMSPHELGSIATTLPSLKAVSRDSQSASSSAIHRNTSWAWYYTKHIKGTSTW